VRVGKSGRMRVLFVVSVLGLLVFVFGGFLVAFTVLVAKSVRDWFCCLHTGIGVLLAKPFLRFVSRLRRNL